MILTDNETQVGLLNNEAIASCIIALLSEQPVRPVTIGVHGDWGAGKSSILEMIEAGLGNSGDVLCLKFNGWRFQGFEDAKIALIEGIVTGLVEKRPAVQKAAALVKDVFRRIDWLKVAKHAGGLAVTAFTGIPTPDQLHAILGGLEKIWADPAQLATKESNAELCVFSACRDSAERAANRYGDGVGLFGRNRRRNTPPVANSAQAWRRTVACDRGQGAALYYRVSDGARFVGCRAIRHS
jgi:KAP family P-loop domain